MSRLEMDGMQCSIGIFRRSMKSGVDSTSRTGSKHSSLDSSWLTLTLSISLAVCQ